MSKLYANLNQAAAETDIAYGGGGGGGSSLSRDVTSAQVCKEGIALTNVGIVASVATANPVMAGATAGMAVITTAACAHAYGSGTISQLPN